MPISAGAIAGGFRGRLHEGLLDEPGNETQLKMFLAAMPPLRPYCAGMLPTERSIVNVC